MQLIELNLFAMTLSAILLKTMGNRNASLPFSSHVHLQEMQVEKSSSNVARQSDIALRSEPSLAPSLATSLPSFETRNPDSAKDAVPNHMRDFHRRVLEHIHGSSEDHNKLLRDSPKYMVNLYNHKVGFPTSHNKMNTKQRSALRRSDVVRSFEAIESYRQSKKWILVFDISEIGNERIRLAEIQVTMFMHYRNVTTIEVWDQRKASSSTGLQLKRSKIGSIDFDGSKLLDRQRITGDVTRMLRRWYNNEKKTKDTREFNYNNDVQTNRNEMSFFNSTILKPPIGWQSFSSSSPESNLLFVYSTTKNIGLIDVAVARRNRHRRSSKRGQLKKKVYRKYRYSKQRNRRKNKTEKKPVVVPETRFNDVENNIYYSRQMGPLKKQMNFEKGNHFNEANDEVEKWRREQTSDVTIVKDKIESETTKILKKSQTVFPVPSFPPNYQPPTPVHCRRVEYTIDFEKIGWGDWIIYPKRFNAYRCEGACRIPLVGQGKPSSHAFIQSLLSFHRPTVSQPCCVPSKLRSMSILYYEDGIVKQREQEDMIVEECVCS